MAPPCLGGGALAPHHTRWNPLPPQTLNPSLSAGTLSSESSGKGLSEAVSLPSAAAGVGVKVQADRAANLHEQRSTIFTDHAGTCSAPDEAAGLNFQEPLDGRFQGHSQLSQPHQCRSMP